MLPSDNILTIDILCYQRSAYGEHLIKYVEEHHLTWEQVIVWFKYRFYFNSVKHNSMVLMHFIPKGTPDTDAIPLISSLNG